jgi:rsbT co-antagonist protein RsbR
VGLGDRMSHYMSKLRLDEAELRSRRAFFEITDQDLAALVALRPAAERSSGRIVEGLYQLFLGHEGSRAFLRDPALVARLKKLQHDYFLGLFTGRLDLAYVEDRLRVGAAHERVGLEPKWYIGAYGRYLRLIRQELEREIPDRERFGLAMDAITKVVHFDMALAMDIYVAAFGETIARQQAAVRELSTPVIRIHDRVLLLPIIGTVDSDRARQIMETLLSRIVEEQARVVMLDIAGVPVVDTSVANYLLETTAAVRLLGAETILTGISPHVARTIVKLGVDVSTMTTTNRLADGLEVALRRVGRTVAQVE